MLISSKFFELIRMLTSLVQMRVAQEAELILEIKQLNRLLRLRQPGLVFLKILRKDHGMLFFKFALPALSAPDVVRRELNVQVGNNVLEPIIITGDALNVFETPEFSGKEGDLVRASLVDIDDAFVPNRSEASVFEDILVDSIAPPKPGALGIINTREEADPVVPPVDPVEPTDPVDPVNPDAPPAE